MRVLLVEDDATTSKSIEMMPKEIEKALCECLMCEVFLSCDYNLDGKYYVCPNRDFIERVRRFVQ